MDRFSYQGSAAQIVFGAGRRREIADWVDRLGRSRALILATPRQSADVQAMQVDLGDRAAGVFTEAAMHTPVEVTERAMEKVAASSADCVIALGGGSTTGLGKAIAYRSGLDQIVVPTTYAGSEVTPVLGQTAQGVKTTVKASSILPEVVIYDPELTLELPIKLTVTSGLNAMAHAAEALYAEDQNPITSLMAVEGLRAMGAALPKLKDAPRDEAARSDALYGAWLCGTVLGAVDMALHHKICHTLGGSFNLPHADTHAVMLPHTIGYNAVAASSALQPLSALVGGAADAAPGGALWDFAAKIGAPLSLRALGLSGEDLERAADLAAENPYWNPRPIDRDAILALLRAAWSAERPAT